MSSDSGNPSPSTVLVMGKTGVGKSTFIKAATGLNVLTGNRLDSCTAVPQLYPIPNTRTFLLDTPGFDDPSLSDTSVLQSIASCLADIFDGHVFPNLDAKISGIIYIQAINEPRMTGSMLQNLTMLRLLIGEENMEHCMLVTTKWGLESLDVAGRREQELIQTREYWGGFLAQGAAIARYEDSQESALEITRAAARPGEFIPQLMQEYAVDGMELCATAAGRAIDGDVSRARERNEQELEKLRGEYKRALDDENAESTAALNAVWIRIEESLRVIDEETQELRATRLEAQEQLDQLEEIAARTHPVGENIADSSHWEDDLDKVSTLTNNRSSDDGLAPPVKNNDGQKATVRSAKDKKRARQKRALRWFARFTALGGTIVMGVVTDGILAPVGATLMAAVELACQEDKNRQVKRERAAERT